MKQSHLPIFFLILSAVIAMSVLAGKKKVFPENKKSLSVVALALSQQHSQPKPSAITTPPDLAVTEKVQHAIPSKPSPLEAPSAEELREFPGAIVLVATEIEGPEPGQKTRLRILNTHFKYPNIRTEEIIDNQNNSVVMRQEMVADHFLVTLAPGEDPETFFKSMGDQVTSMERVTENAPLYRVELASSSLKALPTAFETSSQATAGTVEPDGIVHACSSPNDPNYQIQWGLWPQTLIGNQVINGIDAEDAWSIRTDASSIIVAVLDSGIRYTHEDLAANMWNNHAPTAGDIHGWNAYANNGDPMDDCGHGTICAGIIGAVGNNGIGVCGVAWKVQLMACRFMSDEGGGTESDEVICIDYAINHGAKILNCSFGALQRNINILQAEKAALTRAQTAGVIVVCAAGNENQNNDETPFHPANWQLDNIVSVAATNPYNNLASFSNYGANSVHLAAPGVGIYSTYGGQPENTMFYPQHGTGDSAYAYMDGTSAATPFVAGALALLMAQFPNASYSALITHVLTSTDQLPSLQGKIISGGQLNIAKALGFSPLPTPWYVYDPHRTWEQWWRSL